MKKNNPCLLSFDWLHPANATAQSSFLKLQNINSQVKNIPVTGRGNTHVTLDGFTLDAGMLDRPLNQLNQMIRSNADIQFVRFWKCERTENDNKFIIGIPLHPYSRRQRGGYQEDDINEVIATHHEKNT